MTLSPLNGEDTLVSKAQEWIQSSFFIHKVSIELYRSKAPLSEELELVEE